MAVRTVLGKFSIGIALTLYSTKPSEDSLNKILTNVQTKNQPERMFNKYDKYDYQNSLILSLPNASVTTRDYVFFKVGIVKFEDINKYKFAQYKYFCGMLNNWYDFPKFEPLMRKLVIYNNIIFDNDNIRWKNK